MSIAVSLRLTGAELHDFLGDGEDAGLAGDNEKAVG